MYQPRRPVPQNYSGGRRPHCIPPPWLRLCSNLNPFRKKKRVDLISLSFFIDISLEPVLRKRVLIKKKLREGVDPSPLIENMFTEKSKFFPNLPCYCNIHNTMAAILFICFICHPITIFIYFFSSK